MVTTIALDAMGSDHGPAATVEGAAILSREEGAPRIVVVGDRRTIEPLLARFDARGDRVALVHAPQVVPMDADPKRGLDANPDASILVAAQLVRDQAADALVSAGNTGAVALACSRAFERLPGIRRAGLGAVYPTERLRGARRDPFSLILDVGLTLEADAVDLVGFAIMGSAYAAAISRNEAPRVALLSNGAESHKGPRAVVEAHRRLSQLSQVSFIGNVEGMDIPAGTADVVVTGGFVGNIVLKMLEGVSETMKRLGRYAMNESLAYKAGLALLSPAVKKLRQATDWQQYGGVPILGFDHLCIKAHGRSGPRAIANALKVARNAVRSDTLGTIRRGLTEAEATRWSDRP